MVMPTQDQVEAFNILRKRGVFNTQQNEIISLLEQRGELEANILPIMQKIRTSNMAPTEGGTYSVEDGVDPYDKTQVDITPPVDNNYLNEMPAGFVDTVLKEVEYDPNNTQPVLKLLSKTLIRPGLQTAGAVGGGIVGSGATPVAGTVAGSALGFAIGDDIADLFDNIIGLRKPQPVMIELGEAGKNIVIGAAYEVGGQAVGKMVGAGSEAFLNSEAGKKTIESILKLKGKIPPLRASAIKTMTGKVLAADMGQGRGVVANNIDEAQILEELIPGLKFQYGQLTDDAGAISFEKVLEKEVPDFAAQQAKRQAENIKAIQAFIEAHKTTPNIGDTRKILQAEKELVETGSMSARQILERQAEQMAGVATEVESGKALRTLLESEYKTAKKASSELFEAIPKSENAPTDKIISTIERMAQTFDRAEDINKNFPDELKRVYENFIQASARKAPKELPPGLADVVLVSEKTEPMSYNDVNNFRKYLSKYLEQIKSVHPSRRNKLAEKRIAEVIDSMENVIVEGAKDNKYSARAIKEARKIHRTTVYEPFQTGRVKEVLADKISDAKIAKEFFQPGAEGTVAAREFKAALGSNPAAKGALSAAIKQDLLQEAIDPVTQQIDNKKLIKWLSKYRYALKELDMLDNFKSIESANRQVLEALDTEKAFNKSVAADILKSDPGQEIANILSSKYRGQKMLSLMRKLGGDKQAIKGVQNALIEEAQKVPITSATAINKFMQTNKTAYEAAFADNKAKLQALKTYQQAINKVFPGSKPITGSVEEYSRVLNLLVKKPTGTKGLIGTGIDAIKAVLKHRSKNELQFLATKASLDPEFAFNLMYNLRHKDPSILGDFLNRALRTYGMIEHTNKED